MSKEYMIHQDKSFNIINSNNKRNNNNSHNSNNINNQIQKLLKFIYKEISPVRMK